MTGAITVLVTCSQDESEKIAASLIEDQLAACVNIISGITSIYRWQGKICRESECLLLIKSERRLWKRLAQRVKDLHSYQTPEIIAIPIEDGYPPYLDWIKDSVKIAVN